MNATALHDAYVRMSKTGPEFDGWLSNHGPMAAEAMWRHGHEQTVNRWLDRYELRLKAQPQTFEAIHEDNWHEALGDPRRLADWPQYFDRALGDRPWRDVLATWWPRLLPGIAAGATHGVIRVGHVVRVLREGQAGEAAIDELANALGYWAARWQPIPQTPLNGACSIPEAVSHMPRIPRQEGGIRERLDQLESTDGWLASQASIAAPAAGTEETFLREVITAAVHAYNGGAHGNPVMLVHAATAPNAVLRTLPSLPADQWALSAATAWAAVAAIGAAYLPTTVLPGGRLSGSAEELFERAVAHGDEHVIKFADTASDVFAWTQDETALRATGRAMIEVDPL